MANTNEKTHYVLRYDNGMGVQETPVLTDADVRVAVRLFHRQYGPPTWRARNAREWRVDPTESQQTVYWWTICSADAA